MAAVVAQDVLAAVRIEKDGAADAIDEGNRADQAGNRFFPRERKCPPFNPGVSPRTRAFGRDEEIVPVRTIVASEIFLKARDRAGRDADADAGGAVSLRAPEPFPLPIGARPVEMRTRMPQV